ncbi:MAG TPA: FAD-dependent oxidoreductase [Anaerolineales bacterium]|nr:FAD-dependent oxidoreductase [Anaerolineales bacterium]
MGNSIIVGSSYAGLAAALELRSRLPSSQTVIVVSLREEFIFYPSLIWVVQGERELKDISFPIRPVLEKAGITFVHARLERINTVESRITLSDGQELPFDKLLIATGGEWDWGHTPGLQPKPQGFTISMLSPGAALDARKDWQALLADPGPIVIGLDLNASLYGAAYEFALNLDVALRKAGVREESQVTFITPEPYLGHFGHDGLGNSRQIIEGAFASQDITYLTEAQIDHIEEETVVLGNMRARLPSRFTMIVPPYRGIGPVREVPDLGDAEGRIPVDSTYRSQRYPNIFAAGAAIQIKPAVITLLPCGVFIPGTASAEMGRVAATNIAADLGYGEHVEKPATTMKSFYVFDSAGHGLFMSLGPQSWLNMQLNVPGPWGHWAKIITEKYQMWQLQAGRY